MDFGLKNIDALIQQLIDDEGCELTPYHCTAKYWTLGIGTNLETNPPTQEQIQRFAYTLGFHDPYDPRKKKNDQQIPNRHDTAALVAFFQKYPITEDVAREWLIADLEKYVAGVRAAYPSFDDWHWKRQNAIVNMAYNLGLNGLSKFKSMKAAIEGDDWEEAAKQALDSRWARQVKGRSARIAIAMRLTTLSLLGLVMVISSILVI